MRVLTHSFHRFQCLTKNVKNLLSARRNHIAVQELIELECKKGFLYGPFDKPPFESYRVSPCITALTGKR